METLLARLTVYFEEPFWVGVYERTQGGATQACRVVFGAQPKEGEVYAAFLKGWRHLRFGPPVPAGRGEASPGNPKRVSRAVHRQLERQGVGTKAQQALSAQREQAKREAGTAKKQRAREEKARQFSLRQEKKKEKHRGH